MARVGDVFVAPEATVGPAFVGRMTWPHGGLTAAAAEAEWPPASPAPATSPGCARPGASCSSTQALGYAHRVELEAAVGVLQAAAVGGAGEAAVRPADVESLGAATSGPACSRRLVSSSVGHADHDQCSGRATTGARVFIGPTSEVPRPRAVVVSALEEPRPSRGRGRARPYSHGTAACAGGRSSRGRSRTGTAPSESACTSPGGGLGKGCARSNDCTASRSRKSRPQLFST